MDSDDFPSMPRSSNKLQALEASASTVWSLLFLLYSSSSFLSEFSRGWSASWTLLLVFLPVILTGTGLILDKRPHAMRTILSHSLYILLPSFLQLFKHSTGPEWETYLDVLTVTSLWLPLQFRLLGRDLSVTGTVAWPLLIAALTIINTFSILAPFPDSHPLGYSYKLSLFDIATALAFAIPAVTLTALVVYVTRFAKFKRAPFNMSTLAKKQFRLIATFVGLFMNAVAEELLFRGLIFNMIALRFPQALPTVPTIASSLMYAGGHLNKKKMGFDRPNVRFACCGAVSSVFHCIVWHLTAKVPAAALTHAIVDLTVYQILVSERVES